VSADGVLERRYSADEMKMHLTFITLCSSQLTTCHWLKHKVMKAFMKYSEMT